MLLSLTILILISVGGSLSDECERCDRSGIPRGYPETAEELMKSCKALQEFGSCDVNYKVNCKASHDEEEVEHIRHVVNYLRSTCNEDNPTFKVISEKLQCLKTATEGMESCGDIIREENRGVIASAMEKLLEEEHSREVSMCLWGLMRIKCAAIAIGHQCGEGVEDAVEEVLTNVGFDRTSGCTPEVLEELDQFLEVYEAILREDIELRNELDKRK
nr:venom protein [Lampona murina]